MNSSPAPIRPSSGARPAHGFAKTILRLVKNPAERQAIESGQIDAIVDAASGSAILLPDAQRALLARSPDALERSDVAHDGSWIQDAEGRFTSHFAPAQAGAGLGDGAILGKTLWELGFDNLHDTDWQAHRQLLAWRAPFRDLELRRVDIHGRRQYVALSGEPLFDEQQRFLGYRGILRQIGVRRAIELQQFEHRRAAWAALDAVSIPVCVLDETGIAVLVNSAWRRAPCDLPGFQAGVREGDSYLDACLADGGAGGMDGAAVAAGIRQVIGGERRQFRYELAVSDACARSCCVLEASAVAEEGRACAVVTLTDISRAKGIERLLSLELAVARQLAEAAEVGLGLQAALRVLCDRLGWDCGRFLRLDRAAGLLRQVESWGVPGEAVQGFLERSTGLELRQDAGLAGRVVQSGQAVWDYGAAPDREDSSMALAQEIGAGGSCLFPASHDGEILGVLAFSGALVGMLVGASDERLMQTLRSVGDQVGGFLQRMRALEDLRCSETRYRSFAEISSDWHWEQDPEFRFTRIVGSGPFGAASALGLTHWELPDIVPLDAHWAEHRSRLAAHWSFCDVEFSMDDAKGNRHRYLISGVPVFDAAGVYVGYRGTGLEIGHRPGELAHTAGGAGVAG